MKFNIKSKIGFTLIELLVVIGILAVLAAIAIPSVAGLIDRANQSADQTNANEMTNAMERFVSEYELYRQDITSNRIDFDNLDSAQGRVYNVTGAKTIADIQELESEVGLNGIRIDINSKYAQNHKTAKAVIENYMKTSSSTFEPKQSDMTYWYNTVTGYTIVAEKNINTATLENLLPTVANYNIESHDASVTEWIDLSSDVIIPDIGTVSIFFVPNRVADDGTSSKGFYVHFTVPNPKFYETGDYSKVFLLKGINKENEVFDKDNSVCTSIASLMNDETLDYINNSNDKEVPLRTFVKLKKDYSVDTTFYFRLCYEYEDNGIVKYSYSPTIITQQKP